MGRKSKLSNAQWAEIERRLLEDESGRALAKEFGVSEASIREHFKDRIAPAKVQEVAQKILEAEVALEALPPLAQKSAHSLAQKLRSISDSLASAADLGAMNSYRLQALANSELQKVDDADPLGGDSGSFVKNAAVLTKVANECAYMPLNLVSANKDAVKRINEEPPPDEPDSLTPERLKEGARRIAFLLESAASQ